MLTLWGNRHRFCDGLSRRHFLQVGALGLTGLSLADLLRLRAQGATRATPKSVIMVWLGGGPPQIDMYDMKPDAPVEYRGQFKPIRTKVPGLDICELLPLQAKIADRFSVLRSLTFPEPNNHDRSLNFSGFHDTAQRPAFGSLVSRFRYAAGDRLPHYVSMVSRNREQPNLEEPTYAGAGHRPFRVGTDDSPSLRPPRGVTIGQLEDRRKLLKGLDTLRRDLDTRGELAAMDTFTARAFDMVTSPKAMEAFDLTREPDRLRESYGGSERLKVGEMSVPWAPEKLLLARRLVEAGVSAVTVPLGEWDLHGGGPSGGNIFEALRSYLPRWDRALYALLTDLKERGLDRDVAVVVWGEMGRGPRVNQFPGRDHWSESAFALFAGGGLQMGKVVGATDANGLRPRTRRYGPQNVLTTLYHVLGIDAAATLPDHTGRPMYLLDDREPIAELV